MKKILLFTLSIIVALLAFVYIGSVISGEPLTLRQVEENKKIYIGVFEPLTGYNAAGGNQEALGLEYARTVRPTVYVGGKPYDIEFVLADNASEATAAELAAQRLVSREVSAVFGSFGSSLSAVGGEIFSAAGIPMLGVSCTNSRTSAENSMYFRLSFSDNFQGGVLANFSYGQGYRHAAVFTQAGDSYSRGLGKYFTEAFTRLGGTTEEFSFSSSQMNFEEVIEELLRSKVDCIFMPSSSFSASVFILQARQAGLLLPVIGGDTWDSSTLITDLGEYGSEIYFSSPFSADDSANSAGGTFALKFSAWAARSSERLEQNGGTSYATPFAALAYDAYMLLCDAIEAADSSSPSEIADQLKTASLSGVTGKISFNSLGESGHKTAYIKTINVAESKFILLKTYLGNQ